jgi:hypothetical protein
VFGAVLSGFRYKNRYVTSHNICVTMRLKRCFWNTRRCGMDWWIYVLVGMVVGMNLGYMVGIRRGTMIVGDLISGIADGIANAAGDKNG